MLNIYRTSKGGKQLQTQLQRSMRMYLHVELTQVQRQEAESTQKSISSI